MVGDWSRKRSVNDQHNVHFTGGHVRVGLEDAVYLGKGELAKSNAQFVKRIVELAKILGREVATPDEAREILGLKVKSVTRS